MGRLPFPAVGDEQLAANTCAAASLDAQEQLKIAERRPVHKTSANYLAESRRRMRAEPAVAPRWRTAPTETGREEAKVEGKRSITDKGFLQRANMAPRAPAAWISPS